MHFLNLHNNFINIDSISILVIYFLWFSISTDILKWLSSIILTYGWSSTKKWLLAFVCTSVPSWKKAICKLISVPFSLSIFWEASHSKSAKYYMLRNSPGRCKILYVAEFNGSIWDKVFGSPPLEDLNLHLWLSYYQ